MKKLFYSILASFLLVSAVFAQNAVVPSVDSTKNRVATYRAVITNLSVASSPTDIFNLSGSATKTIYVKRIAMTGTKTTSGSLRVDLVKRSTANSGGTSVGLTEHPLDSSSPTATGVAVAYTANTTVGTGVIIGTKRTAWLSDTAAIDLTPLEWNFGEWGPSSFAILRGTAQSLSLNLGGITQTGGVAAIEVEWMEQ
jgi:hypothetical protein